MQIEQSVWSVSNGWRSAPALRDAQLVLVFGDRDSIGRTELATSVTSAWPSAVIIGCSTAGQILGTDVFDDGAVATAVTFNHTQVRGTTAAATASGSA
jgi:hypothetical protein